MAYFLDLFAGIGGFSLGAQWAGIQFDGHYYSEIDKYAIKVYEKNFPGAIPLGDIKKINGKELPNGEWIIAGGFPCQDISVAGKGAGLDGTRSGLWYEYARLIGELRPRYAIMENVGALTVRGLDRVLGSLAEIGYDAEWQDIRASDVGAPHRRERIWIIAYPERDRVRNESGRRDGQGREGKALTWNNGAQQIMADPESRGRREGNQVEGRPPEGAREARERCGFTDGDTVCRRSTAGNWLPESGFCRVAHGIPARMDRLKCLGNSIVPQIAEMIFAQLDIKATSSADVALPRS